MKLQSSYNRVALFFIVSFLVIYIMISYPLNAKAAYEFKSTFGRGSAKSAEIKELQKFLINRGYYTLVTGSYLSLTKAAVRDFQSDNGIRATGYFGPLTQALVNKLLLAVDVESSLTTVTTVNVSSNGNTANVLDARARTVTWTTGNYPAQIGVDINLLIKVPGSDLEYTLVRNLAKNVPNTGTYSWINSLNESGNNYYVEVTCAGNQIFEQGCRAGTPAKIN